MLINVVKVKVNQFLYSEGLFFTFLDLGLVRDSYVNSSYHVGFEP